MKVFMAYKGKFVPKHKEKYAGDPRVIVWRSLWERNVMRWMDSQSDVIAWNSEEVIIPYLCETDNRPHKYHIDFWFKTKKGTYLIEVKPKKECSPPVKPKRKTKRYVQECLTYIKNQSKWKAAKEYADYQGWEFQVWHEDTLKGMGIKLLR